MSIEVEHCYICLENLNIKYYNDNKYLKCGCLNRYHAECLHEWAENQNKCPICRKKIEEDKNDNDNNNFDLEVNNGFYPLVYFIFYILVNICFFLLLFVFCCLSEINNDI